MIYFSIYVVHITCIDGVYVHVSGSGALVLAVGDGACSSLDLVSLSWGGGSFLSSSESDIH